MTKLEKALRAAHESAECNDGKYRCRGCGQNFPCLTIKIIEENQPKKVRRYDYPVVGIETAKELADKKSRLIRDKEHADAWALAAQDPEFLNEVEIYK